MSKITQRIDEISKMKHSEAPTTNYELRTTYNANQKIAIVCDWLVGGGAEKVVEALHKLYPEAPIYTSYATNEWRQKLDGKVVTGYLQYFGRIRKFVPFLRGWWFSHLNLKDYDLIISSSGAEAKFVKNQKPTVHINYCHAPTHYYWDRYDEYLKHPGFPTGFNWLARMGLRLLVEPLRKWDFRAAQQPDVLIANSNFTKAKIKEYYGRDSVVVHPPVEVEKIAKLPQQKRSGFVAAGRQTPYKRIDLAVEACTKLSLPLTVLGDGPENKRLRKLAGPTIVFQSNVAEGELYRALCQAEAFIFPGIDDFGIVAVEALAAGTPVIAYKDGGALDYVVKGKTGEFFTEPTVESLASCLQSFEQSNFDPVSIKKHAEAFSVDAFSLNIKKLVTEQFNQL